MVFNDNIFNKSLGVIDFYIVLLSNICLFYGISTIVGLFNAKSSLYIYIYIYIYTKWFGLVGFYGISTFIGLFNAKSS